MIIGLLRINKAPTNPEATPHRLVEAGRARGHQVIELYEPEIVIQQIGSDINITHQGSPLPKMNVIINRPGYVHEPGLHTVVTNALRSAGYKLINGGELVAATKSKLTQRLHLAEAGIATPKFALCRTPMRALAAAKEIGFPLILKVAFGTHGKGVFFAENIETFLPIADYLAVRDGNPVIVEEFIKEAGRKDLRLFVVGNQVVAAMQREAKNGDVRANASIGGVGSPVELTEEEKTIAIAATKAFDLQIAGVDILRSDRGPLVIEVNANPGFEELERATGIDVAGAIIDYIEDK
ncbi:MAG: RimK family alpha-L-glutamate ligase [Patescibacteria group bacterium]